MIMKNKNTITDKFEKNICFTSGTRLKNLVLVTFVFLCFFALLSGVSAANFNSSSTNDEIQAFLNNTTTTDNEVVFDAGDYNQTTSLNVSRSVNITSNGQVNIKGPNTGTLFNITAPNVQIIKLNITGYDTAIKSNSSNLTIIGNNITTNNINIDLRSSGGDLTGISIVDNIIVCAVNNSAFGAVYVYAPQDSGAVINVSLTNNNITNNGLVDPNGVRFNAVGCSLDLIFENNNITGKFAGVYLLVHSSNNTNITFTNNNITGTNAGVLLYGSGRTNNTTNNTIYLSLTTTSQDQRIICLHT
jgi:hypothetical protein